MSGESPLLAGLDVGTTHTKAGVYRTDGTAVAERQAATPADAETLCATTMRLIADCVTAAEAPPVAVGVASMAETGTALDAEGGPVGELLHWRDGRAGRQAWELGDAVGRAAFFAATGLHVSARLPLARWIWLRRHDPGVLRRMARWANAADLVVASLTGAVATSPTLAARTGAYDIGSASYAPELLDLAGLRADQMPPVVAADEVAGHVTPAAAAATGLRPGTPVAVAGHDHLAAAWAAGVRTSGQAADSMGTAEAIVTPVPAPPPATALSTGVSAGPFVDGRSFCLIGGLAASGGLVEWLLDRIAPADRPDRNEWFTELVGPPGRAPTGIIVQPYLHGRAAPAPDARRALSCHGVRPEHTAADLGRAVLEGLSMHARWMLETQLAIGGTPADTVTVFGGPAVNPTWMSIKAGLMPATMTVLPGRQCATIGAAQLAGRAIGVPDPPLRGHAVRPVGAPEWAAAYARFRTVASEPRSEESP